MTITYLKVPKNQALEADAALSDLLVTKHATNFDYAALEKDVAERARSSAEFIRLRIDVAKKNLIQVGTELCKIKALLAHGQFSVWIKSEFNWSHRTAQLYMTVAKNLGSLKSETVSLLPPSIQYKLAAANEPVLKAVVAKLETGELAPGAVKGFIAEHQNHTAKKKVKTEEPTSGIPNAQQSASLDKVSAAPAVAFLKNMLPSADLKQLLTLLHGVSGASFLAMLREA